MNNKSDITSIQGDLFIDQLRVKMEDAIKSKKADDLAEVQLEMQLAMLQYLQRIDWKLWEFYNKFGI